MEEQQSFWQLTVIQALGFEHVSCDCLIFAFCNKSLNTLTLVLLADSVQGIVECKFLDAVEILLLEVGSGYVVVCVDESEHVLEHAAGSTRGRNKLHYAFALGLIGVPAVFILFPFIGIRGDDTIVDTCRCFQLQEGESGLELIQLILDLLLGNTLLSNLL